MIFKVKKEHKNTAFDIRKNERISVSELSQDEISKLPPSIIRRFFDVKDEAKSSEKKEQKKAPIIKKNDSSK